MMTDNELAAAILLMAALYAAPLWVLALRIRKKRREFRYTPEVADTLEEIGYLNQQARQCEELHTDIDLTNPYQMQGLSLTWNSGSGASRKIDLYADGQSRVTEELRILAGERLAELTSSLSERLDDLNKRTNGNGNGYVTDTTDRNRRGGG